MADKMAAAETTPRFLRYFFMSTPRRTTSAVVLLGAAGLLEGVGVVSLIPLLQLADRAAAEIEGPGRYIIAAIEAMGLHATFPTLLAVLFVAVLVKAVLFWIAMTQVGLTQIHVVRELRLRLVRAMLRARWQMFATERAGGWANALATESTHAGGAYREGCEVVAAAFPIVVYITLASLLSWRVTVFALVSGAVILVLLRGFVALTRRSGSDYVKVAKHLASITVDILHGMKPIKAMGREHLIEPLFRKSVGELDEAQKRTMYATENLRFFQEPTLTLLLAVSLYLLFSVGQLPLATVIVLAFMFYRILQHLNTLQLRLQHLATGEMSFWSLMERIERTEGEREREGGTVLKTRLDSRIEFEGVSFAYQKAPVLKELSFVVEAGHFVSIEGESGSGKTTLVDLIGGLHLPTAGRVSIDGANLQDMNLRRWRSSIGYVPQEMLLLNDSIRSNVSLGDADIDDADVEHALRLAGAWDFVEKLPGGLDSEVGERGSMLSGGQRQRISLARALVTKPTLLILDEATAALDPETEADICNTLASLPDDVTILAISHQHAMRSVADEAYRMIDGTLVAVNEAAPTLSDGRSHYAR